jgi:flagellar basal-body rod protein FlgF
MLYGLYLSATGVMNNSYRQDVIANNLANAQTNGFKRDLAMFRQRPTAAEEDPSKHSWTDSLMENIGGGNFAEPTKMDLSEGSLEQTGNTLDAAIDGPGYFTVQDHGQTRLTRDGQFLLDNSGNLITANGHNLPVLDTNGDPIKLDAGLRSQTLIGQDGTIRQGDKAVAKLAVVDVPDPAKLKNEGATLLSYPDPKQYQAATGIVRGQFVENANVDPATEMAALMDTQRQLEANANMIHYQDSTLDKLVNTVGRIS